MTGLRYPDISLCTADDLAAHIDAFAALLHACVHDGASISFVLPFTAADADAFWRETVLPPLRAGGRTLLAARQDGRIAGTVQLIHDTPPNQPHRAEVSKLLVHPGFRHRGIARALMAELERHARAIGRSLITLDTRTGDSAEPLYASLGFETAGVVPDWARDPFDPARLDATTFMYKRL